MKFCDYEVSLLIFVLYVTLPFFRESGHDDLIGLLLRLLFVFQSLAFGVYGCMDLHRQRMPIHERNPFPGARVDIEGTVQRNGYDWQLQFVGQLEGTSAENAHVSGESSCSLRENDHGSSAS